MGHTFEIGVESILNIELIPNDGYLRLTIHNDLQLHDSLFVKFISPTRQAQFHLSGLFQTKTYPMIVTEGAIFEEVEGFPSEEFIKIYWDYINVNSIYTAAFSDSVYLPRYDTIDYTIHF